MCFRLWHIKCKIVENQHRRWTSPKLWLKYVLGVSLYSGKKVSGGADFATGGGAGLSLGVSTIAVRDIYAAISPKFKEAKTALNANRLTIIGVAVCFVITGPGYRRRGFQTATEH